MNSTKGKYFKFITEKKNAYYPGIKNINSQ